MQTLNLQEVALPRPLSPVRSPWSVWPTLAVLAVGAATLASLLGASYCFGCAANADVPELRFLNALRPPTVDEASLACVGEYAARSHVANDVIFLGDSACRSGIDPVAFERLTGLRAYNLGTFGSSGPSVLAVSAKAYLANHPRPHAVVLCVSPVVLRYQAKVQVGSVAWRFAESYGSHADKPFTENVGLVLPAITDVMRQGASRALVELRTLGQGHSSDVLNLPLIGRPSETYSNLSKSLRAQRGCWVLTGEHQATEPPRSAQAETIRQAQFVSSDWDPRLDEIAGLCKAARIPLLLRVAPLRADVARTCDFSRAEQCIEAVHSRNPDVILKRPILSFCDRALCWDSMHLNDKGADKFTAIVAGDVEEALSSRSTVGTFSRR